MKRIAPALGLTPFVAYVLLFLAVPTLLAIASGFAGQDGFTLDGLAVLTQPNTLSAFGASVWVSALTAVVGAAVGAVLCWALAALPEAGPLRRVVDAASSVLAQFGGVMLAFAFIATIGIQGVVTVILREQFGIDIFAGGVWLYELPGLILPYLYFQVPLMVITFLPAVTALRPDWSEAVATLGGTSRAYWRRVGLPVLAPAFLGSLLLLFANAFSSYATAAALISQGSQIVPLQIRAALIGETGASQASSAGVLALGMVVVMTVVMLAYGRLMSRAARWQR
ncbi:ABC transporter permease [Leucobacter luti]|uniref:Putative spermidine/putrescine transport system permease protein n=1 Tax=Leucobacter luti TaxID=340320 RepID=A0A4Q7U322_9MICO|nr:ABC transporter permease [Leucobacter luti]MBL3699131.1 ABC transporter permease [Leucobacter luti]RZT66632.1 putative spermidine/putrescine transport system permease protein [Leucobacter luti]